MQTKPHILFVCTLNQWRSPTAAKTYANDQRIEVRSAGVSSHSVHRVSQRDLEWADLVLVMEPEHKVRLLDMFNDVQLPAIECLDISNELEFMDEALVGLIRDGTETHLAARFGIEGCTGIKA
ncbi:MAG: protein tyrosine phosphatase [bacterium]